MFGVENCYNSLQLQNPSLIRCEGCLILHKVKTTICLNYNNQSFLYIIIKSYELKKWI